MRKLIIIIAAILAFIVLIIFMLPLIMGVWLQHRYPQIIDRLAQSSQVTVKVMEFQRSWFTSNAKLKITMKSATATLTGNPQSFSEIVVDQSIYHGPFIFYRSTDGSSHFIIARAVMKNQSEQKDLNITADTIWNLAGNLDTKLGAAHIKLGNNLQQIELKQLAGDVNFNPSNNRFQSAITLSEGSLYEKHEDTTGAKFLKILEAHDINSTMDINKIGALWYGARRVNAKKMQLTPFPGTSIDINNWNVEIDQTYHDKTTDVSFTNHMDTINSDQVKVSQVQVALALKGMNTTALNSFVNFSAQGSDLERFKLYPLIMDLLGKGMNINLSQFHFITNDGPVDIKAILDSPHAENVDVGIMYLLENITAKIDVKLPKVWLEKSIIEFYKNKKIAHPDLNINPETTGKDVLQHWIDHHLLVAQDRELVMNIDYKKGDLLINGEKPSLSSFVYDTSTPASETTETTHAQTTSH